ncbi:MAG: 30S ribosomal protein S16 [Patescibacteria group bacterium]|nr:30S ribosomal protein S16 [Patescibacteria group bacterium]
MLAIKFKRTGKKHQASFRIIVAEKRSKVHGRFTDDLGWYNPTTGEGSINGERADYWLKVGAKSTPTVHNLLVRKGIIRGPKIAVHKTAKKKKHEKKEVVSETVKTETNSSK